MMFEILKSAYIDYISNIFCFLFYFKYYFKCYIVRKIIRKVKNKKNIRIYFQIFSIVYVINIDGHEIFVVN